MQAAQGPLCMLGVGELHKSVSSRQVGDLAAYDLDLLYTAAGLKNIA